MSHKIGIIVVLLPACCVTVSSDIVHYQRYIHYLSGMISSFQPGGDDYENDSVVVTFEAGSRFSTNASIPIISDSDPPDKDNEQFNATFELPGGYRNLRKGDPEEAVITIKKVVTGQTQSASARARVCVCVCVCV